MNMISKFLSAFLVVLMVLPTPCVKAQTNEYKELIDFGTPYDYAHSLAIQSDGKVLVAGDANGKPCLIRFDTLGGLDTSFGEDGKVFVSWNSASNPADNDLEIQSDGKILLGTSYYNGSHSDFIVARYEMDGRPDLSFGIQGQAITSLSAYHDRCFAIALQSDGKIVAAGEAQRGIADESDFALVRFTPHGAVDSTFGTNGLVKTQIGLLRNHIYSMVIQEDGKILVAGEANDSIFSDFALARYSSDGSRDSSFGNEGVVRTVLSETYDFAKSVVLQSDGKILVAGSAQDGLSNYNIALVRYHADGSLDASFGEEGKVITDMGNDFGNAVALQTDQKIVVAGSTTSGTLYDFATLRYLSDGSPDSSFGSQGLITTSFGPGDASGKALAIGGDGEIIIAGTYNHGSPIYMDFAIARLFSNLPVIMAPSLSTPENEASGLSINPTMTWYPAEGALSYNLELSKSQNFDSEVISITGLPSTRFSIGELEEHTLYHWRVSSNSFAGTSKWSDAWSFSTGDYTGMSERKTGHLKLYPLPFTDKLFIEGLEKETLVIQIIALDGRVHKSVQGRGLREMDMSELRKGIYLFRVDNGSMSYSEIIIK